MEAHIYSSRRRLIRSAAAAAGSLVLLPQARAAENERRPPPPTEDMMREHGILRRALDVYRHCARQLRAGHASGLATALNHTAQLFRRFGEDYHERAIEEAYVFPMLLKQPAPLSGYPAVLTAQHRKGREVTDYVQNLTQHGSIPSGSAHPLADTLDAFTWMYSNHAAREDTMVYIAWKKLLSEDQLRELTHTFETIEQRHLGDDGFEHAVRKISDIETGLGLADLAHFTLRKVPA